MMEERVAKTSLKKLEDIKLIEFVENIVDFDRNNVRSCDNSNVRKIAVVRNRVTEEYSTSLEELLKMKKIDEK